MENKETIILITTIFAIIVLLLVPMIPFTESQFYAQVTDINYSDLVNDSDNDGKGLLWSSDLNKFEITVLQNDIDGGYAGTVYLVTQRTDGGDASGN